MRLVGYEFQKLMSRRFAIVGFLIILFANILLLNITTEEDAGSAKTYKALVSDLSVMDLGQKQDFIHSRIETVRGLFDLDELLKQERTDEKEQYWNEEFSKLYSKYGSLYESGAFDLYTDRLTTELIFLENVRSELDTVANYPAMLKGIQEQAELYNQVSIFNSKDSFDQLNIDKTAADYQAIASRDAVIGYYPQKGYLIAVNFEYTDILLFASMLLVAGVLISVEQDSGLLRYIKSMPRGRSVTAISKSLALFLTSLLVTLILYGSNIIYCSAVFGFGGLYRSIQSLPFLMRSVLPFNLAQYLCIFLISKWFSVTILGLCVMFLLLVSKRYVVGMPASILLFGAQWALSAYIPYNQAYSVIRYVNFVGILRVNDWVGGYLNFNIGGKPVSIFAVVLSTAISLSLLLTVGFVLYFSLSKTNIQKFSGSTRRSSAPVKATTITREEIYKAFWLGAAGIIIPLFCLAQIYTGIKSESIITADEIYYRHYMLPLSGKYDQAAIDYLNEIDKTFNESRDMDSLYSNNEIDKKSYDAYNNQNYDIYKKREAFERIANQKLPYIQSHPGAWLVYESGYKILFDENDMRDLKDTLLSGFIITLLTANIFAQERHSGMDKILATTPLGYRLVTKKKLKIAFILSLAVAFLVIMPRYMQVLRDFGLPAFFAPANSIERYEFLPGFISICALAAASFLSRFFATLATSYIALYISKKTGNTLTALTICWAAFCVPSLIALFFNQSLNVFTLYPFFALPKIFDSPFMIIYSIALFLCLCLFMWLIQKKLYVTSFDD